MSFLMNYFVRSFWSSRPWPRQATSNGWIHHFDGFVHRVRIDGIDFCAKACLRDRFQSGAVGNGRIKCDRFILLMPANISIIVPFNNPTVDWWPNANCIDYFVRHPNVRIALDWTILRTIAKGTIVDRFDQFMWIVKLIFLVFFFFLGWFQCVLASIIVVALKGMLMQVKQFFQFWRMSRLDAAVWLVTFLSVVIFSIDIGLLVGIVLSLSCIFIRGMKPYTCLLGHIPKTDLYLDIRRYKAVSDFNTD